MIIVDFGFFHIVEPEDTPENPRPSAWVVCYENEEGQDWYDMRRALTEWDNVGTYVNAVFGAWAMVDEDGMVVAVEYDPSRLAPMNRRILGIDARHTEINIGMTYHDGELIPGEKPSWAP